ncbi:MAG: aspartate carbamoyltransferase catalytic subunit [Parvularcula sp.]
MTQFRHLTDITSLSDDDFFALLDASLETRQALEANSATSNALSGRLQFNLFFEDSTRTNLSFEVAAKRLGAIVSVVPVAASSLHKGESFEDTVLTLAAQGADALIIRAKAPGTIGRAVTALERDGYNTAVVNAGEGALGHPSQGLLDAATLLRALDRRAQDGLADQTIAICGDIVHSRVAASAIEAFGRLGAKIRLCGPRECLPSAPPEGVEKITESLDDALSEATVAMALRIQKERLDGALSLSDQAYHEHFGLTHARLKIAHSDALIMHPQPMNRGIEISSALADDLDRSLLRSQVSQGVAVRMAILQHLLGS